MLNQNEDYYVKCGESSACVYRSFYISKKEAEKEFNKIQLDDKVTWKELWFEPLEEQEKQILIKDEEVKITTLANGDIFIIPTTLFK